MQKFWHFLNLEMRASKMQMINFTNQNFRVNREDKPLGSWILETTLDPKWHAAARNVYLAPRKGDAT